MIILKQLRYSNTNIETNHKSNKQRESFQSQDTLAEDQVGVVP